MKNTAHKLLALALASTAPLMAQTVPAPSAGASEKPLVLETFTVNTEKDNGYLAVDSLSGGRQAAPIRVTPAAMSSITAQFIDDLAMSSVQDALKWSLNTVPTSDRNGFSGGSGGGVFNFWSVSIRGDSHVQGGNPPTKNYYPLFVISDTYNVDRIEFDHGPNSILFGIGDLGGALTSYTKQARFDKDFSRPAVRVDSYGGYRGTVDVNQHQGNLAVRVNAVIANEKGFRDGDFHKKLGATLAADWKFNSDNSHLRFEIEGWKEKKAIYGATYQDNVSLWNGTTSAATWGAAIDHKGDNPLTTPGAPGVTQMSDWGLNPYLVLVAGSGKVQNWTQGVRSMGTNNIAWGAYLRPSSFTYTPTGTNIMALPSRDFAVAPKDGYVKPEDLNMTLTYDQRINDRMDFEVSGYRYVDNVFAINYEGATSVSRDLNKQLPDGSTNPNFGQLYSDFFLDKQVQNHWVNEVRGQLSYHFDANPFNIPLKQLFSVSTGEQVTEYDARQYNAQDTSSGTEGWTSDNWIQKLVWGRIYWNNPQAGFNVPSTVRYQPLPFNWYDFNSKQTIKYVGAFSQSRLWNDRLNISLGARRDDFENHKIGIRGTGNTDAVGKGAGNTISAGGVGYITDWLGVVANFSQNYQPAAGGLAPTVYGEVLGAAKGTGKSAGLRVSTQDGKYYASMTFYKDTGDNVIGGDHPDFQGIWDDYFKAGGTKTDIGPAGQVTGGPGSYKAAMNYVDTYSVEQKGVEFEVTANPTKNIRIQAHYSAPKGRRTNDGPNGVRYFAQHLADWQAVASGSSTESQKLASDLATAQTNFATWAVPTLAGSVIKSMWNVFATYSFTDDTLKGLDVGFGASYLGGRQIDQKNRTTAYTTESLLLGYSKTIHALGEKLHTRFQLNVDNLFGNDTLVYQSYNGTQAMDYNFIPPRKFTLSASVEF
ncbi:MAG TPA: TonB-dependent receptor plug domain-containing protein [Lacunisphaera sp.]|jgi:outer membrane receptor protein involved in Fe transport|nr:TonB-dependent receptor plug domain-containing protein [Lacunisphaera sp.]